AASLQATSPRDIERLAGYGEMLDRVVAVLRELMHRTPPNVGERLSLADWLASYDVARRLGRLDLRGRRDLLDLFTKSAGALLDLWCESEPLKAALGWDSVVGNFASPYTPGSAYVLLHHVFGETNGKPGVWGHAIGGMGAITQAIAAECAARGVQVHSGQAVERVLVERGRAGGVALADGRELRARTGVCNLNPKLLYTRLVARGDRDDDTARRSARDRCGSGAFRMSVGLSELPDFSAAPGTHLQPHHQSGILVGPSLQYFEK